jgi:GT2 family glycosyltransferase/glycosyltransferase involved in cell wall biosynthesis
MMRRAAHFLRSLPLLALNPLLILVASAAIAITDLVALLFSHRRAPANILPDSRAASIVIPNWNGRDLLEKYLPSVLAAAGGNPDNEVIVVDNGSTDGSAEFVRRQFPAVKLLALEKNHGFGGGSNAGFREAKNDIVVLLNSDMRVDRGFLAPLLEGFRDDRVFAVACQIFFSDPERKREETGLTQARWSEGALRVAHRIDEAITDLFPCFYGGGGSCAFDRRKFLELGGFDPLLRPFYLEDTDLGFMAWKRGWQVLYQPRSVVHHEHRGTIGRNFSPACIQAAYHKNFVLFAWKNIHEWRKLGPHFFFAFTGAVLSAIFGDAPTRGNAAGFGRALIQLPQALGARWRARALATVTDTEAFLRPLGGYFRDRFVLAATPELPAKPRVLFLSPYPIYPPTHGGAVFMLSTLRELVLRCDVHLISMLDRPEQLEAHRALALPFASAEFVVRNYTKPRLLGTAIPNAIREFASPDLDWLIHRQIYTREIDVLQLEYTPMGQYAGSYKRIANILFEHDVYFQSIARGLKQTPGAVAAYEYLRALRYELKLLPKMDRIQVCSAQNRDHLATFLPRVSARIETGLRAGIEVSSYRFGTDGREPFTMLFLGSFSHLPNLTALEWFVSGVLPRVLERCPSARLVVVGSEMPARLDLPPSPAIEMRGFVEDVREPLSRCAVFVCPVLSGSGVRVKLLEAFASGIPAISTPLGAEGLASKDGDICLLAGNPAGFAQKILDALARPGVTAAMARRARREVEANWNTRILTAKLAASYQDALAEKRGAQVPRKNAAICP